MYKDMRISKLPMILLGLSVWGVAGRGLALEQATAIMYQGSLSGNGAPVNGFYDLSFTVYDSATQGQQIGASVTKLATVVTNGGFTVNLEFGSGVFTGPARWLEITVSTNGGSDLATLGPRQQITAVPYAAYASSAASAVSFSGTFGGDISGAQGETVVTSVNGYPAAQVAAGAATANGGTSANAPSTLVKRDAGGSFSASTISVQTLYASNIVSQSYGGNLALATMPQLPTIDAKANFGAAGDGVTDDTEALQAAINYLGDGDRHSLHLYIPAGKYKISSSLKLPPVHFPMTQGGIAPDSGFVIEGAGMGATQIIVPTGSAGLVANSGSGYSSIEVTRIGFAGPNDASGTVGLQLGAPGCYYGNTVKVIDCAAWGLDYGFMVQEMWLVQIRGCNLVSNRLENIYTSGAHVLYIDSCQITGSGDGNFISGNGISYHFSAQCPNDNAAINNCLISICTNAIFNDEADLTVNNGDFEGNGCVFRSYGPLTVIGSYILDAGVPAPLLQTSVAPCELGDYYFGRVIFINPDFQTTRPKFNYTGTDYVPPLFIGRGTFAGKLNGTNDVTAGSLTPSLGGLPVTTVSLTSNSSWTNNLDRPVTVYVKGFSGNLAVNGMDITGTLQSAAYSTQIAPGDWITPTFTTLAQAYYK
jgi:hypothetical protein